MHVFLTGGTGFLGRALLADLVTGGHKVTALLLASEPDPGVDGVTIVRGDITNRESLRGLMAGCTAVVHLAGAVGYGQNWAVCRAVNRDGTAHVAGEAIRQGIRRFVHMSSVSVYGRRAFAPVTEETPCRRIGDPYGDTKVDAEEILQKYQEEGKLDLSILRPTVIYGAGDTRFFPKLIQNLRSGNARIVGDGRNRVDLIHLQDVLRAIVLLLKTDAAVGKIYNLNNPDNCTWREFMALIAQKLDLPAPTGIIPYYPALLLAAFAQIIARLTGTEPRITTYAVRVIGRPYDYRVDRIRDELGFVPKVDLAAGIADYMSTWNSAQDA